MPANESKCGLGDGSDFFTSDAWSHISKTLALSPREFQIVRAVLDEKHENEIAEELGISPHTVHTYLERLYRKLHVRSRVGLVLRLVECFVHLCIDSESPLPPLCQRRNAGTCPFCE